MKAVAVVSVLAVLVVALVSVVVLVPPRRRREGFVNAGVPLGGANPKSVTLDDRAVTTFRKFVNKYRSKTKALREKTKSVVGKVAEEEVEEVEEAVEEEVEEEDSGAVDEGTDSGAVDEGTANKAGKSDYKKLDKLNIYSSDTRLELDNFSLPYTPTTGKNTFYIKHDIPGEQNFKVELELQNGDNDEYLINFGLQQISVRKDGSRSTPHMVQLEVINDDKFGGMYQLIMTINENVEINDFFQGGTYFTIDMTNGKIQDMRAYYTFALYKLDVQWYSSVNTHQESVDIETIQITEPTTLVVDEITLQNDETIRMEVDFASNDLDSGISTTGNFETERSLSSTGGTLAFEASKTGISFYINGKLEKTVVDTVTSIIPSIKASKNIEDIRLLTSMPDMNVGAPESFQVSGGNRRVVRGIIDRSGSGRPTSKVSARVYRGLAVTEKDKAEIETLFGMRVNVDEESSGAGAGSGSARGGKTTMAYDQYLLRYNTPLVALKGSGERADLNFFVAVAAGEGYEYADADLDVLRANLQNAADIVFRKLKGFEGFPATVAVNIFGLAINKGVVYTGAHTPVVYASQKALADASETCYFGNGGDCSATRTDGLKHHHHLVVWSPTAPSGTPAADHTLVYSTVYPTTTLTDYIKIVVAMTGAVFMCARPDVFDPASSPAFLKASCTNAVGPNGEVHVPLSDMDYAILRQVWLFASE